MLSNVNAFAVISEYSSYVLYSVGIIRPLPCRSSTEGMSPKATCS